MDNRRAVLEPTLLFLVMFLPGYLGQARGLGGTVPDVTAAMVDAILLGVPQILLVLYLVALQPDPGWPQLGLVPLAARDIPAILVAAAGSVAIYAILALGASLLPRSGTLQGGLRWHLRSGLEIPLAIGGSLATGYREELFFRAYLLTRLAQAGVPTWAAAVSSTLLFALGHLYEGPLGIATALCLGAWFCFVFLRTRRLHVVAIAHGLWDAGALALTLIVPALPGG